MVAGHDAIKRIAKKNDLRVADLLALSPGNDPFYIGTKGQVEKAEWFAGIYRKMGSPTECHIRRVHYWITTKAEETIIKPDGEEYLNTDRCWQYILRSAKYARYLGLVPFSSIVDRRNPDPKLHCRTWDDSAPSNVKNRVDEESIINDIVWNFDCYNPSHTQPYHLEIWCEKSTMNDILIPLTRQYGVNLVTGLGELSITAVYELIQRIKERGKPTRIFYISDFDPAGECMPVSVARKIEYFLRKNGSDLDVKLKQLMLTEEQCIEYELPRTPIKDSEKRKESFEERYGTGATELDALEAVHPGEMQNIIEEEIGKYFDEDAWNEVVEKNREIKREVRSFLEGKIGDDILGELDLSEYDEYEPPQGDTIQDANENWILDSATEYLGQIMLYKSFKNEGRR